MDSSETEPCLACGKPVDMRVSPGMPRHRPLCNLGCIKEWCKQTGTEFLTMEEYSDRRRKERGNASSAN